MSIYTYGVAIGLTGAAFVISFSFGHRVANLDYTAKLATITQQVAMQNEAHATRRADLEAQVRQSERARADEMAAIDQRHQEDIANREAISNRTIADLRSGVTGLRSKFTRCQRAPGSNGPAPTTSTGSSDATASIELRSEDASFLIRFASEADQVADQLRACQAVVRADRMLQP
ncbi:lysis system i-spanin subunit Rz [Massilia sp. DJPM01]|uniref:lysis system i-spanin subunit Rz n=1 Tax=Massilia sp. DJPM01 TaxID=3024404 RepID=UPI00259F63EF|nr:lysis system i-spanin subunit Rz [Massilia sp. DJPM01]MDM5178503.1 lysis system i-spanin subunit Rz [Massilia sp. DJPM01]